MDQVILIIGTSKFLISLEEALTVAKTLNACSQISSKWASGGNKAVIADPQIDAAHIAPMTAHFQLTLEQNMKE